MANNEGNLSKTYVAGSIEDLAACKKLILYRSDSFSRISLTVMNKIIESLELSKSYTTVERTDTTVSFEYSKLNQDNNIRYTGFNVIIYLNYLDIPIGYTEFSTVQGLIPNTVLIDTKFITSNSSRGTGDSVEIVNSLSGNIKEYVSLTNRLISDNFYGFQTKEKIVEDLLKRKSEVYNRYTNSLSDITRDHNTIIQTSRNILNYNGLRKLYLITEMTIAEDFDNYQLGYYNGEIVLYAWKYINNIETKNVDTNIYVISLSRLDKFGNHVIYSRTENSEYKTLKNISKVYYLAGRYASVLHKVGASETRECIYFLNSNEEEGYSRITSNSESNHLIDLWGTRSQVIELPKPLNKRNLIECIPEVLSLWIDIKNYKQTINLEEKIGEWYVFRERRSNLSNLGNSNTLNFLVYTNLVKTVTVSEDYDEKPIVINNNNLMLRTKTRFGNKDYDYYTYFPGEGDYYSENALLAMDLVTGGEYIEEKKNLNEKTKCIQYSDTNSNYYESGELVVDHVGDNIINSYCASLRRNVCPDDFKVPEFIGAINGLLYYKNKDKIKLL